MGAECSLEKECLWRHWLTFWQPEQKSSSESSELWIVSRCYKSLVVVLIAWRTHDVMFHSVTAYSQLTWSWRDKSHIYILRPIHRPVLGLSLLCLYNRKFCVKPFKECGWKRPSKLPRRHKLKILEIKTTWILSTNLYHLRESTQQG